jgi:acyl transferase domain-containing protein
MTTTSSPTHRPAGSGQRATGPAPWPLAADTPAGLRALAADLRDRARDATVDARLVARRLAGAPATGRYRAVVLVDTGPGGPATAAVTLDALTRDVTVPEATVGVAARDAGPAAFVFPGQGSQWPGMAAALRAAEPTFDAQLTACGEALAPWVDWSLDDVLDQHPDAPGLDRVEVVQPALFAVMVALAALWESYGVRPAAVVGHSQGEIAAACAAGALSLADAARAVALRSRALRELSGLGGMMSVPMPLDWVRTRVAQRPDALAVAAINGPGAVVVSGDGAALAELMDECAAAGVRARVVRVDYPSHSAQVERVGPALRAGLSGITFGPARVPFYSAVHGGRVDTGTLGSGYWYDNLRHTVRFEEATRALLDAGVRTFVEVSPHPVLAGAVRRTAEDAATVTGTLRRGDGGPDRLLASLAEAWVAGVPVRWDTVTARLR